MTSEAKDEAPRRSRQNVGDAGQEEVQSRMDEINRKGYDGVVPDPTPNVNYTATHNDDPTPETDDDLADQAAARQRALSRGQNPDARK